MNPPAPLIVVVRHADGRSERLRVESHSVLVGSAAHCEVRLPMDQAADEHVLLVRQGEAVAARALCRDPLPTIDGDAFTAGPLAVGAVLALADTRIVVSVLERASGNRRVSRLRRWGAWMLVAAAGVAGAVGVRHMRMGAERSASLGPPAPPSLWSAQAVKCRVQGVLKARQRAAQLLVQARAKHLRGAFLPVDAVAAVPLYEEAADCFRRGERHRMAAHAESLGAALRQSNTERYRAGQLRLELALEARDWQEVDREVAALTAMLGSGDGAYHRWLSALRRRAGLHAQEDE